MTLTTSLIDPWSGPYGGLPPFDTATPAAIEAATLAALELKRGEIAVIVDHPAPPDFENTIAALEDAGRPLKRLASLAAILFSTRNLVGMAEVEQRLAPLREALEDEIAHNPALFARIDAVAGYTSMTPEQARLVEVIHRGDDAVYVRGTLREGELVIVDGTARIVPGQGVRVTRSENPVAAANE